MHTASVLRRLALTALLSLALGACADNSTARTAPPPGGGASQTSTGPGYRLTKQYSMRTLRAGV